MNKILCLATLTTVLWIPPAWAEGLNASTELEARSETSRFELSSVEELAADGWQQTATDIWRKTFDNGDEAEITFGGVALERATQRIEAELEALGSLEKLDERQELRLHELLVRHEELQQVEPRFGDLCGMQTCGLCTGTAIFDHALVRPNFAYPFVQAKTIFGRTSPAGSAMVAAEASFCGTIGCDFPPRVSQSGSQNILTALVTAGGNEPTFSCTGEGWGLVYVYGSGLPLGCRTIATYTRNFSC
ncbi:MAG: hypothetical protein AAF560_19350 [Acidobacteriota bacterium]